MTVTQGADAIIRAMEDKALRQTSNVVGTSTDLAFAVVVLASYFATFSSSKEASLFGVGMMAVLGVGYILIGIYGYAVCVRSKSWFLRGAYFAVQIPLGAGIVYLGKGAGLNAMVLVPLAAHAVVLLSQRWSYLVSVLIVGVYLLTVRLFSGTWGSVWAGLPTFLAGLIFVVVFTQLAVDEEKARKEIERLMGQVEELTVTRERNRLAREIHDGLGHYLTTIYMQVQAAKAVMPTNPARSQEMLEKAQSLAQEALLDVRQSVSALRLHPDEERPLPEMIKRLTENGSEEEGGKIVFELIGQERLLSPQANWTLYRAAQEGINNARKHAQAGEVRVVLDYSLPNEVHLVVRDDGVGAEELSGGFGLLGLRERVHLLNGSLEIETSPGEGLTMNVGVPG